MLLFFIVLNVCLCYNYIGDIMKIDKIQKLKNNRYKIKIDGDSIITFDNVIIESGLLYKTHIDDDLYSFILKETEYYDNYYKVMKYILKKRRSLKEIKEYLIKFNLTKDQEKKLFFKLTNNNLINDEDFCRAFINDSLYLGKKGINKIKEELINKGISNEIIEKQLECVNNELLNNNLQKIVIKKIKLNKKYSNNYLRKKILNELLELGYDKESILHEIDNNLVDDSLVMKLEFEKIYKKYSKKYNGYDLIKNVKGKMFSKGFDIDKINELLQEKTEE